MLAHMYKRLRAARQNESGFTLIELLIVIVILGVLAGIVVFSVSFLTDRGTTAACKTDYKSVQAAIEAYYAKNSTYPTTGLGQLVTDGELRELPANSAAYNYVFNSATNYTINPMTGGGAPVC